MEGGVNLREVPGGLVLVKNNFHCILICIDLNSVQ